MADLKKLSFTGNGLIVVQSRVEGRAQQVKIEAAASIGTLAGEIGSTFTVTAAGDNPWTMRVEHQRADGQFEDSPVRLGAKTNIAGVPVQFVESERDTPAPAGADFADLILRVERATAVAGQGGGGTTEPPMPPQPPGPSLWFMGNARVVIHGSTGTKQQQVLIENAATGGTLAVALNAALQVTGNGTAPWTIKLQRKDTPAGAFQNRNITLGPVSIENGIRTQFVSAADNGDTVIRIEQVVAQVQPADGFVVQGQVRWSNGNPFQGTVKAFDRDLRSEQLLGTATTDLLGNYKITYTISGSDRAETGTADVVVRAMVTEAGVERALGESPTVFNAGPVTVVDLVVGARPATALSEYELLDQRIVPLLDGALAAQLTEDKDVLFLAAETGAPPDRVWFYTLANKFQSQLTNIPPMVFYALLRQGVGVELQPLLESTPARQKDALTRSGDDFIISVERLGITLDEAVTRLQAGRQTQGASKIKALLTGTTLPDADINKLVALEVAHVGTTPQFWAKVRALPEFSSPAKVADVQFAVQAFALADGNLPLARLIQGKRPAGATDARALLNVTTSEWQGLIRQSLDQGGTLPSVSGNNKDEQIATYASALKLAVEGAFATTVVGNRAAVGPAIDVPVAKTVLQANPTLDPKLPLPANVNLNAFPAGAARQHAVETMALVREEALTFPTVDMRQAILSAPGAAGTAVPATAPPPFVTPARAALANVFTLAPQFDLTHQRAIDFIAAPGSAIPPALPADVKTAVTGALRATQRLYNIVPRADFINGLLKNGLSSATAISRIPEATFIEQYRGLFGGDSIAQTVHRAARRQASGAAMLFALVNRTINEPNPYILGGTIKPADVIGQAASWATLFGQIELAECPDCRSVHGPAAYYVALLHFLDTALVPDGTTGPIMVLDARRRDLLDLKLTCDNTHTLVSHADLANEVMAAFVGTTPTDAGTPLRAAVFPFTLPFDLDLESERLHLEGLGTTRYDLLTLLRPPAAPGVPTDAGAEWLGIAPALRTVLTETAPSHSVAEYFGYDAVPAHGVPADLAQARVFLRRTGLSFIELLELVTVRFIKEVEAAGDRFRLIVGAAPADINAMTIGGVNDGTRGDQVRTRVHRFLRLWKTLRLKNPKLTLHELDVALMTFPITTTPAFDASAQLLELARAEQVRAALKLDVLSAYTLWGRMDTTQTTRLDEIGVTVTVPSFYESVFDNPAFTQDPAFKLTAGEAAGAGNVTLVSKIPELQSALRVSQADVEAILADAQLQAANVSVANLSVLFRYALLARALKLSVKELIALRKMSALTPFSGPAVTRTFIDLVADLKTTGFKVAELVFLLTGASDLDTTLPPAPARIEALRRSLDEQLRKIDAATDPATPDPTGERLQALLEERLRNDPAGALATVLAILDGTSPLLDPARQAEAVAFFDAKLPFVFTSRPPQASQIAPLLANPADSAARVAQRKIRHDFLFDKFQRFLRTQQRRDAVLEAAGGAVGLSTTVTRALVDELLRSVDPTAPAGTTAMADFQSTALATPTSPPAPRFTNAFLRLHEAALLINGFELTEDETRYFQAHGTPDWAGFDLNLLPTAAVTAPSFPFAAWRAVSRFRLVKRALPAPPEGATATTLTKVFELAATAGTTLATVLAKLAAVTQWTPEDVTAIAAGQGLTVGDLKNADRLPAVRDAVAVARRVGVAAAKLATWAGASVDRGQADDVRATLKAQFDADAWARVSAPIDDRLRDRLREALIAFLLASSGIRDLQITTADQLYEYFLIDVQMTSVMKTSRLVQATAAVQLFIQRCLLNLELQVSPKAIDSERWKWMKNFRVWEANRKVFLYPENFLEPELRTDKTPFFQQLETDLMQGEITPATVEAAYLSYLRKLDDVGHIEIVGHCHDFETGVEHVFGRTNDDPPVYYYRRFEEGSWTGWDRVPLEIESEHIAPVIFRRRLYLFWAIFKEKAVPPEDAELGQAVDSNVAGANKNPKRRWEVSLGWSELQDGKWSPKRISKGEKGSARKPTTTGSLSLVESAPGFPGFATTTAGAGTGNDLAQFFQSFLLPVTENPPPSRFTTDTANYRLNISPYFNRELLVNLELGALGSSGSLGRATHFVHLGHWALVRTGLALAAFASNSRHWIDQRPENWIGAGMSWRIRDRLNLLTPVGFLSDVRRNAPGMEEAGLLATTPNGGTVLFTPQDWMPVFAPPYPNLFFQDGQRAYFVDKRDTTQKRWEQDQYLYPRAMEVLKYSDEVQLTTLRLGQASTAFASSFPYYSGSGLTANIPRLVAGGYWREVQAAKAHFAAHYHAHTGSLIELLNRRGVEALFATANQEIDDAGGTFVSTYKPTALVHPDFPRENFDFSVEGAYSTYNWELFFHIPMLIAGRLSRERRFEEAQRWYHFIFDPTSNEKPEANFPAKRYWRLRPFRIKSEPGRIQDLLLTLADPAGDPLAKASVQEQIEQWSKHPFQPHRIARLRLAAYQKMVFFKYVNNLVAWADQLFAQDTRESITQATQLYVLANNMLGPRPERIPEPDVPAPLSYRELRPRIDDFGNALVSVEDLISTNVFGMADTAGVESAESDGNTVIGFGETLYFCIPQNKKLLGYWDTIADRLFKIRNGLNLQGVARSLDLFAPEINPADLVRAAAAGLDIGQVVSDLASPLGFYRLTFMLPKALELCNDVKAFGAALLVALEKKDAEALGNLRAHHETGMLELIRRVREQQIKEAETALAGLEKTREMVQFRRDYFTALRAQPVNPREQEHLASLDRAQALQAAAQVAELVTAVSALLPNFSVGASGFGGSPHVTASFGGANVGSAAQAAARALNYFAGVETHKANRAALLGGWDRRSDEWKYQADLADKELAQIDRQIEAAQIRIQIANQELDNQDRQIENAREVETFLRDKFTNGELYNFLVTQTSGLYFQAYQLAYQLAKQAERAYRFERGLTTSSFVSFGAWDSLKRGLLAGEGLAVDLRRLEMTFLQENGREYELTKNVSLLLHDPAAFVTLKETGRCEFRLPEALFDLDHPGQFMRRIKTVGLSIPCVAGPYTGVHARLTLLSSRIRAKDVATDYTDDQAVEGRFLNDFSAVQSIATSTGQNDTGLFELNFRDERYLPFEGAGAESTWRLELPKATNAFDFDTITDVVMRVQYTAREGGEALRRAAIEAALLTQTAAITADNGPAPLAEPSPQNLARAFSIRHEFPDAWNAFLRPAVAADGHALLLALDRDRFPARFRALDLTVNRWIAVFKWKDGATSALQVAVTPPGGTALTPVTLASRAAFLGGTPFGELDVGGAGLGAWTFAIPQASVGALPAELRITRDGRALLNPDRVQDLVLIANYVLEA